MNRRHTLEAISEIARVVPVDVRRANVITLFRTNAFIENRKSTFAIRIHNIVIARFWHAGAGFTTAGIH